MTNASRSSGTGGVSPGARAEKTPQPKARSATAAHRYTLRVPVVDTSIEAWWAAQDDPSASVRALVREEIMKHGFTDTVNRPVTQMPRRGRPPGSTMDNDEPVDGRDAGFDVDALPPEARVAGQPAQSVGAVEEAVTPKLPVHQKPAKAPVAVRTEPASGSEADSAATDGSNNGPAQPVPPIEQPAEEEPADEQAEDFAESGESGQLDMAEIFGH
ncbi:hypothetical protein [Arthrobacter bambusae]|uniref:Centromere-binding protein ParB C-terminal domain-containing protein n=1 Tax=Arthrobacter bambusae TaxID=1338426 RepID=A0AAW8D9B2_9MICC|nr:hypothetical protein [Arthrobacter bambusae]MDP9903229.1 hypothetical protein [Arthrobacter bambusae]MDQ0128777.1 hypothetical protein [Arthrobacter bambusae]MDQ0180118.1 hypothetical protein [Arthrobacter bambusae]